MPKSTKRKRNGRPVAMHRPGPRALVAQRAVASLCDDLDDLVAAVPLTYDVDDLMSVVRHHHHATALVNFLRVNDVVGILAAMGGGDMIAVPAPAPEVVDEATTFGSDTGSDGAEVLTEAVRTVIREGAQTDPLYGTPPDGPWITPASGAVAVADPLVTLADHATVASDLERTWLDYNQATNEAVQADGGFATDTATLERIASGAWVSDAPAILADVLDDPTPVPAAGKRPCARCGRTIHHYASGSVRPHNVSTQKGAPGCLDG